MLYILITSILWAVSIKPCPIFRYYFYNLVSVKSSQLTMLYITLIESIGKALDEGNFACGIFLDLQKAFDTVDHTILINKLQHYGIHGIPNDWFSSYL